MNRIVAITIGDINGIGIDILIKTYKSNKIYNFILFTNIDKLEKYLFKRKIKLDLNVINKNERKLNFVKNKFNVYTYKSLSPEENTYKSLRFAYNFCIKKFCIGIITLPLRKDIIKNKIDKKFIGHTEYFQKIDKKKYANMILFHKRIIVSPITNWE